MPYRECNRKVSHWNEGCEYLMKDPARKSIIIQTLLLSVTWLNHSGNSDGILYVFPHFRMKLRMAFTLWSLFLDTWYFIFLALFAQIWFIFLTFVFLLLIERNYNFTKYIFWWAEIDDFLVNSDLKYLLKYQGLFDWSGFLFHLFYSEKRKINFNRGDLWNFLSGNLLSWISIF